MADTRASREELVVLLRAGKQNLRLRKLLLRRGQTDAGKRDIRSHAHALKHGDAAWLKRDAPHLAHALVSFRVGSEQRRKQTRVGIAQCRIKTIRESFHQDSEQSAAASFGGQLTRQTLRSFS